MKKLKLTIDYEFNRLTKNYLADAYEKIIPQKQHLINFTTPEIEYVLRKWVV